MVNESLNRHKLELAPALARLAGWTFDGLFAGCYSRNLVLTKCCKDPCTATVDPDSALGRPRRPTFRPRLICRLGHGESPNLVRAEGALFVVRCPLFVVRCP